ncbi:MAG: hypothetical protein K2M42_10365 [Oscillospiraceae bacterium]|nr:hypothetical protein [Oscillospiraceae bacterium]
MSGEPRFQFRALQGAEAEKADLSGSSKIRNICEDLGSPRWAEELTLAYGRLLTLFGPALYVSKDMENEYGYHVLGEDGQGNTVYLNVYSGPSGPAIGGKKGEAERQAADELAELILSTPPADYEYTGYYMDGPSRVHKGVRGGKPFMQEQTMGEGEFNKAIEELYGK